MTTDVFFDAGVFSGTTLEVPISVDKLIRLIYTNSTTGLRPVRVPSQISATIDSSPTRQFVQGLPLSNTSALTEAESQVLFTSIQALDVNSLLSLFGMWVPSTVLSSIRAVVFDTSRSYFERLSAFLTALVLYNYNLARTTGIGPDGTQVQSTPFTLPGFASSSSDPRENANQIVLNSADSPDPASSNGQRGFSPSKISQNAVWYDFTEGTGTTLIDRSGQGYNASFAGQLSHATWTETGLEITDTGFTISLPFPELGDVIGDGGSVFVVGQIDQDGVLFSQKISATTFAEISVVSDRLTSEIQITNYPPYSGNPRMAAFSGIDIDNNLVSLASTFDFSNYPTDAVQLRNYQDTKPSSIPTGDTSEKDGVMPIDSGQSYLTNRAVAESAGVRGTIYLAVLLPDHVLTESQVVLLHNWARELLAERGLSLGFKNYINTDQITDISSEAKVFFLDEQDRQFANHRPNDNSLKYAVLRDGQAWVTEGIELGPTYLEFNSDFDNAIISPSGFTGFAVVSGTDGSLFSHYGEADAEGYVDFDVVLSKYRLRSNVDPNVYLAVSIDDIPTDDWFSTAFTFDVTTGEFQCFSNGSKLTLSVSGTPNTSFSFNHDLTFGGKPPLVPWNGKVATIIVIPDYIATEEDVKIMHNWAVPRLASRGVTLSKVT